MSGVVGGGCGAGLGGLGDSGRRFGGCEPRTESIVKRA